MHRNAQRLLRPLLVANPFAEKLTFIDDKTRTRRDHLKYLTLIRAIALLHQYQREVKTVTHKGQVLSYVEVTKEDIETANRLAHEVLGRSLDELPPQTRTLLWHMHRMVSRACQQQGIDQRDHRFSRRDIRHDTGWTDFQVRTHLSRLVELEYLLVHRGGRGQSFVYELLYDGQGQDGEPFLSGLIDVAALKYGYDEKFEGQNENNEGSSSSQRAVNEPPSSGGQNGAKADAARADADPDENPGENAAPASRSKSYRSRTAHPLAASAEA